MRVQQLIVRSFKQAVRKKHADKSTLVANCVSAPLATNVDLWNPILATCFYCTLLLYLIFQSCFYLSNSQTSHKET